MTLLYPDGYAWQLATVPGHTDMWRWQRLSDGANGGLVYAYGGGWSYLPYSLRAEDVYPSAEAAGRAGWAADPAMHPPVVVAA